MGVILKGGSGHFIIRMTFKITMRTFVRVIFRLRSDQPMNFKYETTPIKRNIK